jgi:hypothetical protein
MSGGELPIANRQSPIALDGWFWAILGVMPAKNHVKMAFLACYIYGTRVK